MGLKINPSLCQEIKDMQEALDDESGIVFDIGMHPDGSWSVKSINIEGIITGGLDQSEMSEMIKDAIFTYY